MKPENKNAWGRYSKEEKAHYKMLMENLCQMRDLQRRQLTEFDNKTFQQAYEENRKADLGYNEFTDDPADFRITTGLTREKDTTILSTLLNFDLQPNITAFDKNNTLINELGSKMEDLVIKSREIEIYPEKRTDIYRELIAQGAVYVEEVYTERAIVKKSVGAWSPTSNKISDFKNDAHPLYDVEGKCEAKLYLGKYVLFSSMNEPELQNNGMVALYEEVDRSEAEAIYSKWDRWDCVPEEVTNETPFQENTATTTTGGNVGSDYIWNVYKVGKGKVGITKVMKRFSNEYMILLNGVMVLPVGYPLTAVSPSGLYNVAKGLGERIPKFAVGKGIPSKTKVDQRMYDTVLRAMVGKQWQSFKPALGNRSGNVLSRDIITAGQFTHGIKQNDIFPILPTQLLSISNGDVSMFEMMKQIINEKSVTDSYAAQNIGGSGTATEVVNQQKQTMLKLAATIDGVRALERRLILLRIYNIIANWTKADESPLYENTQEVIDGVVTITGRKPVAGKTEKKYKQFTQDSVIGEGKKGLKMTHFVGNDAKLPTAREHVKMEDEYKEKTGKEARISFINAEWLRVLEAIWNVDTILASKDDDNMQLLMYLDNLTRVGNMFGMEIFQKDYVLQRIASKMKEDYDKMFSLDQLDMANMLMQASTQVKNPAQQRMNSGTPTPLSTAKVM